MLYLRHLQEAEGVGRDVDGYVGRYRVEVDDKEQHFVFVLAQEGVLTVFVETPAADIGIHQVEEQTMGDGFLLAAEGEYMPVNVVQALLVFGQHPAVELAVVAPAADGVHAPVIKNGGAPVTSAEPFMVHTLFTEFLSEIHHHRVGIHAGRYNQSRNGFPGSTGKEFGCDTLLVVVFQKVQHPLFNASQTLPAVSDGSGRPVSADNGA